MSWQDLLKNDPVGTALLGNQVFSVKFIISPETWKEAKISPPLSTWKCVSFKAATQSKVPEEPGLYAFVAKIPTKGVPPHGWVMYIGQAGNGKSKNTLRKRYGDYLANQKRPMGRSRVFYMLNVWAGHLDFFFVPLPSRKMELTKLETKLLDAFRPPFTDRTYSATFLSPGHAF